MTEKKSKKNTKREIRKVIYRIHSVVFCVWKMNLSSQSYFMVQCIMSHSGSVWHLFLGERCTTILKKKKKYAIFGQCDLYYFLRRYLTSWQSANIPAPVYSIGLPKKKAVYHVSYIKFVTSNRNIILTCTCIMSIKPFSDIFSLILLMTSSLKTHTYNAKSPRSND